VLLVNTTSIPASVATELNRLNPAKIIVLLSHASWASVTRSPLY